MAALHKRVLDRDEQESDVESADDAPYSKQLQAPPPLQQWATVVVLCCVVSSICSIDRTAMSVAVMPMAQQYGWSESVKGAVSGAFNLGYMVTNLVGGYWAAVHGPKRVLSAGVVAWSLFTLLTPVAAATASLSLLLLVRALMGLGEGVAFPCFQVLLKAWVPPGTRTRALSLVYSGHQLGNIVSLMLSPPIIRHAGWPSVFYVYGAAGFVWLAAWEPCVQHALPPAAAAAAAQQQHTPGGTAAATAAAAAGGSQGKGSKLAADSCAAAGEEHHAASGKPLTLRQLPWRQFLSSPAVWALVVAHSMFGSVYNTVMAWLPSYYNSAHNLDLKQSALLSVLPFAVMAAATNAAGWLADGLMNHKLLSASKTRKLLQMLGTGFPALCLGYLAVQHRRATLTGALALLTAMLGGMGLQAGGFAATHQDISTKYAGMLFGFTNACASLAGSISVFAVGAVLDATHSWGWVFAGVMACNLVSMATFLALATSKPLFD